MSQTLVKNDSRICANKNIVFYDTPGATLNTTARPASHTAQPAPNRYSQSHDIRNALISARVIFEKKRMVFPRFGGHRSLQGAPALPRQQYPQSPYRYLKLICMLAQTQRYNRRAYCKYGPTHAALKGAGISAKTLQISAKSMIILAGIQRRSLKILLQMCTRAALKGSGISAKSPQISAKSVTTLIRI